MDSIYIASAGCSGARLDPNTCRKECQYRCQIKCRRECQLEWSRMSDRTSEYDRICSMPYALPDSCYVRNYVRIIRLGSLSLEVRISQVIFILHKLYQKIKDSIWLCFDSLRTCLTCSWVSWIVHLVNWDSLRPVVEKVQARDRDR